MVMALKSSYHDGKKSLKTNTPNPTDQDMQGGQLSRSIIKKL